MVEEIWIVRLWWRSQKDTAISATCYENPMEKIGSLISGKEAAVWIGSEISERILLTRAHIESENIVIEVIQAYE